MTKPNRITNKSIGNRINLAFEDLPDEELSIERIVERQKEVFRAKDKAEKARQLVKVKVNADGPFGILHFGDPHLDDDGTDWDSIERDIALVRKTNGLFAANIGDTTNNWIGRLARLYGEQSTSARQAWRLAEHFFNSLSGNMLYVILGNHDLWSGQGDPLRWITSRVGMKYDVGGVRIQLTQSGKHVISVNARHDYPGNSQWNDVHGPVKAAKIDGYRDDIYVCGHKHKSGYANLKDPGSQKVIHCLQLSSYKKYDRYAKERGFLDLSISPSVVTVINPNANPEGRVNVFWDVKEGAKFLTYLRKKK